MILQLINSCYGCQTDRPLQKQYMKSEGCLDKTTWEDILDETFDDASKGMKKYLKTVQDKARHQVTGQMTTLHKSSIC